MDRRAFFGQLTRAGWLALMAAVTGVFLMRRQVEAPRACREKGTCNACPVLGSCELPEARKERAHG